jgi:hypothetical protein
MLTAREEKQRAKDAAWYARAEFRRAAEARPVKVEGRTERRQQQMEDAECSRAESRQRQEADRAAELTEQRRHELAVARSWGHAAAQANSVVDEGTLNAIASALNSLVARTEALEEKVRSLGDTTSAAARKVDALSAKTKSGDERKSRQLSIVERKLQDQHDFSRDLKAVLQLLKAKIHALESRPPHQETHIIHHGP